MAASIDPRTALAQLGIADQFTVGPDNSIVYKGTGQVVPFDYFLSGQYQNDMTNYGSMRSIGAGNPFAAGPQQSFGGLPASALAQPAPAGPVSPNFDIYARALGNGAPGTPNANDSLDTILVDAGLIPGGSDGPGSWSFTGEDNGNPLVYTPKWAHDMGLQANNQSHLQGYTNTYGAGDYTYAAQAAQKMNDATGQMDFNYADPNSWIRFKANDPRAILANTGKQSALNGVSYDRLDANGNVIGTGTFDGLKDVNNLPDYVVMAIAAGLMGGGAAGLFGGGGTGAGIAGAEGFGAAGGLGAGGLSTAELEAALNGIGDSAMSSLLPAGSFAPTAAEADAIFGAAGAGAGGLAGGAGSAAATQGLEGVPPPANPSNPLSWLNPTNIANVASSAGLSGLLGPAATLIGGALGSQPQQKTTTQNTELDPRLAGPVFNDLVPRASGLLNSQMPQAMQYGNDIASKGGGLLSTPVAGNGYTAGVGSNVAPNGYDMLTSRPVTGNGYTSGAVQMTDPMAFMSPFYGSMADDISRRTADLLGQNSAAIRGNAVGVGGLGGSRQAIAEGTAAGKAADYLQGNLANLGGSMYQNALSASLGKFNTDTGFFTAQRGQDLQKYLGDADIYSTGRSQDIANAGQHMNFYGQQRNTDLTQAGMGADMLTRGIQLPWAPLQNTADIFKPFTPAGSTSQSSQQGGGFQGALGGLLSGAGFANKLGLFGS